MNRPLLYLLLCMLLLPSVGSGQGIEIKEYADEVRNDVTEYNYDNKMLPSINYRLENPSLYLKKNVRKIELFEKGKELVFMACFDTLGRVVSQIKPMYRDHSSKIKTDSIFEENKIIVVDSFFVERNLQRIDTHIIEKIENQKWNNTIVSYDMVCHKFYKKGNYLEERNDYYKIFLKKSINHPPRYNLYKWSLDYLKMRRQIDGNFLKMHQLNQPIRHKPKMYSRKKYDHDKFYLCQKGAEYTNILGADKTTKENLMQKSYTNYYVVGEDFGEFDRYQRGFISRSGTIGCGGGIYYETPHIEKLKHYNAKALIDTIFKYNYYKQTNEEPCLKPIDSNYNSYLNGYSGIPKSKYVEYTFRYEYFEE